jgi:signal transduction histidine kinase/ligand-binding sensor domain-containing protein
MRKLLRSAAFLCLFLCLLSQRSARAQYRSTQWTADNGLPQNSVRGIVKGVDGYIWVATLNGVAKFDGVRFRVFDKSNTPAFTSSRFTAMVPGSDGDLWLPSEDGNLVRYYAGHFESLGLDSGIRPHSISGVTTDYHGGVWVGSDDKVLRWNPKDHRFAKEAFSTEDLHFTALRWVSTGFWATRGEQLFCFARGTLATYLLPKAIKPSQLGGVAVGADNIVWLRLKNGDLGRLIDGQFITQPGVTTTYFQDPKRRDWKAQISDNFIRRIVFPSGGSEKGVVYNVLTSDDEGNAWLGSDNEGLFRIQKQSIRTLSTANGLASDNVYPVLKARDGDMWVGSWPAGLSRIRNGQVTAFRASEGLPGLVSSLYEDRAGALWVGTHNGVRLLSNGHLIVPKGFPKDDLPVVQAMYQSADGLMMLGTAKGIFVPNGNKSRWLTIKDGLATDDVRTILEDRKGDVWIGGYGGVTRIRNGEMERWTENQGLPSNNVRTIVEDSAGEIWVGTYDGGIGWFHDGKWIKFDTTNGLYDNGAFQILEDEKQRFWISSNRGIYRVGRQQLKEVADGQRMRVDSIAYGRADGMLSVECNGGLSPAGAKDDRGLLWFPTQKGVAIVDPSSITVLNQPPKVAIESAFIDQKLQAGVEGVVLRPGQSNLEVEYTALTYSKPEQVSFRYKLDGIDDNWQESGLRRTAYYPHLPPGDYTFRVSARNSDGVTSISDAVMLVTVTPPFYRRWWFLSALIIAVIATTWKLWNYRVNQLRKDQASQQAFSRELIASQENERRRIAAELHDSLGQRLIIINNLALFLLRTKGKVRTDAEKQETIEEINAEASHAIEETRAISYALRPFQLDRLGLARAVQALVKTVSRAAEIEFHTEIGDIDEVFPDDLRINFYRIVQEALNNIVKHADATRGSVIAECMVSSVVLRISDNGRGIPTEPRGVREGPGGFGLTGMRERATVLKGEFQLRSEPGNGTLLTIEFPIEEKRR